MPLPFFFVKFLKRIFFLRKVLFLESAWRQFLVLFFFHELKNYLKQRFRDTYPYPIFFLTKKGSCFNSSFWEKAGRAHFRNFSASFFSVMLFIVICFKIILRGIFRKKFVSLTYFMFIVSILNKRGFDCWLFPKSIPSLDFLLPMPMLVILSLAFLRYFLSNIGCKKASDKTSSSAF